MTTKMIRTRRGIALASALALAIAAVSTATIGVLGAADPCGAVADGAIAESTEFTPYEAMRTKPTDPVLVKGTATKAVAPLARYGLATLADRPLAHTSSATDGSVYAYFAAGDIDGLTRSEFLLSGGVEFDQDTGDGSFAKYLLERIPDRAVAVAVGPFEGAVTWGDPLVNGVRPHGVYWSDGKYNFSLMADLSAADLVSLARDIAC